MTIIIQSEKDLGAALFATAEGRLFCGLLMAETGVFSPGARDSPERTYLVAGERNVGLRAFGLIRAGGGDPMRCLTEYEQWRKWQIENLKEE